MAQSLGDLKLTVLLEILKAEGDAKKFTATLKTTEDATKKLNTALGNTNENTTKLSGVLVNAGLRFEGFMSVIRTLKMTFGDFVREYNKFTSAQAGLDSISLFKGIDANAAKDQLSSLNAVKTGLLDVSSAATSLKNLLAANFTLEQSIELINRLSDAAAFGRQSSLSFGQAVSSATEGIKNGNSVLVDNAGVTKNLSIMLEQAGYKAQDLMKAGEDAGVRMAIFNGILTETTGQLGDVSKLSSTAAGEAAKFEASFLKLKIVFGEFISKAGLPFLQFATDLVKSITNMDPVFQKMILSLLALGTAFVVLNKSIGSVPYILITLAGIVISLPSGLREVAAAIMVVVGAVWLFNTGLTAMNVLSGGVLLAIGAIVTGIATLSASFFDLGESAKSTNEDIGKLSDEIKDSTENLAKLNKLSSDLSLGVQGKEDLEELQQSIKALAELYPEIVVGVNSYTGELLTNADAIQAVIEKEKQIQQIRNNAVIYKMVDGIKKVTEEYSDQLETYGELENQNKRLSEQIRVLEKDNIEYAKSIEQGSDSTSKFSGQQEVLGTFIDQNESEIQRLKEAILENNAEMYDGASVTADLKNQILDLITVGMRTNNLSGVFDALTSSIGNSASASETLKGVFASLSSSAIASLLGISSTAKHMATILWAIAQGQRYIAQGNYEAANAMFVIAKSFQDETPPPPSGNTGTKKTSSKSSSKKEDDEKEKLNELQKLQKRYAEINDELELNTGLEGATNDLLKERLEILQKIEYVVKGFNTKITSEPAELNNEQNKINIFSEEAIAIEDIHNLRIQMMDYEHEKRLAQIEFERQAALKEIDERNIDPGQKNTLKSLTNQKFNKEREKADAENISGKLNEGISASQQIASILGLGADNFVSKFLNGLQSGIGLATSILKLLSLFGSGGATGILSFLGFASGGPVPGSGSGDTVPAMLTPGEYVINKMSASKLGPRFLNLLNGGGTVQSAAPGAFAFAGGGESQRVEVPYILRSEVKGKDLKFVLTNADKVHARRNT